MGWNLEPQQSKPHKGDVRLSRPYGVGHSHGTFLFLWCCLCASDTPQLRNYRELNSRKYSELVTMGRHPRDGARFRAAVKTNRICHFKGQEALSGTFSLADRSLRVISLLSHIPVGKGGCSPRGGGRQLPQPLTPGQMLPSIR